MNPTIVVADPKLLLLVRPSPDELGFLPHVWTRGFNGSGLYARTTVARVMALLLSILIEMGGYEA